MTPQLQQAIKMLQLNNIELSEAIEEELAQNPLLEKDERLPEGESDASMSDPREARDDIDRDFDEVWQDNTSGSGDFDAGAMQAGSGGNMKFELADDSFENRMSEDKTLRQHLNDQLNMACSDPRDRMIGALLIDRLDESGYLRGDHAKIAEQLGCKPERMEGLLNILRGFDPTGVFAADLADCMALQLEERGALDEPMRKLLDNIELLGKYEHKKLCDVCGVNETYLKEMIEEIRTLNPRPASDFDHLVVQTAIPDVLMRKIPSTLGGGWRVELNTETLPRVLVNNEYYKVVSSRANSKQDKEYLNNQLASANWIVRALDQRAQTILKVAGEIIEEQDAFFNYGIEFLKPLKLKDIAEKIEMHESTVSRVTTNKYIGTPRGLFELKFFFSTGVGGEDGGIAHSSQAIKARIKSLIDDENPKKILSDDKLVTLLKSEGIDVARRTVAKYREALGYGSSVQRRREKKNRLT